MPRLTEPMAKPSTPKFCPWDITPKFTKHRCFWNQASSTEEHVHCVRGPAQLSTSLGNFISSKKVLSLQSLELALHYKYFWFWVCLCFSVYEISTYIAAVMTVETSEESNIGKSWVMIDLPIIYLPELKIHQKKKIKLKSIDFIYLLTK